MQEHHTVEIRSLFYRDGFGKILIILLGFGLIGSVLVGISLYLYLSKPLPLVFSVDKEWRVQPAVPLYQPYLTVADLSQWIGDILPKIFTYDFNSYNDQLERASHYFTSDGWKVFLNQLNNYVNYNTVISNKLYVNVEALSAPYLLNSGVLSGRYAWWVQIPVKISYSGYKSLQTQYLTLQILVVRVPTLTNLSGIGINNMIVVKSRDKLVTS